MKQKELTQYEILKMELHKDIERVWSIDCRPDSLQSEKLKQERNEIIERVFYIIANEFSDSHDDEWGEMIPLPGSRIATKEEMEQYDKIKLPF
jgi:hypothetical protein